MKLNIGCGPSKVEGFLGVDIDPNCKPDICSPAWKLPIDNGSVEEIYARHFLEHLTPAEARVTLTEWKRVLSKSGVIHIVLPDLAYHCKQLLLPGQSPFVNESNFDHAMAGFYGWVAYSSNPFMAHKWGYTRESLAAMAKSLGFDIRFGLDTRECDIEAFLTSKEPI